MKQQSYSVGEIELREDAEPGAGFGVFASLPNVESVYCLARQFSERAELMPYQQVGDTVRLLVSVYLRSRVGDGLTIAVLTREPYPTTLPALQAVVERAATRVRLLGASAGRFEPSSLKRARHTLEEMAREVEHWIAETPDVA